MIYRKQLPQELQGQVSSVENQTKLHFKRAKRHQGWILHFEGIPYTSRTQTWDDVLSILKEVFSYPGEFEKKTKFEALEKSSTGYVIYIS